jgi:hypothetical protein
MLFRAGESFMSAIWWQRYIRSTTPGDAPQSPLPLSCSAVLVKAISRAPEISLPLYPLPNRRLCRRCDRAGDCINAGVIELDVPHLACF